MLITFEGIDGSGKTTQIVSLVRHFAEVYPEREVVVSKEPGGTNLGMRLRREILHGENIHPHTEVLLYAADRAEHVSQKITPSLNRGAVVICDRFADSTVAYQVAGRGLSEDMVEALNAFATDGITPDLTILLDIAAYDSKSRIESTREEKDRLESADLDFFHRVREKFLELAQKNHFETGGRWLVLDATQTVDIIAGEIANAVDMLMERKIKNTRLADAK